MSLAQIPAKAKHREWDKAAAKKTTCVLSSEQKQVYSVIVIHFCAVIREKQRLGRIQSAERALPTHRISQLKVANLLSA